MSTTGPPTTIYTKNIARLRELDSAAGSHRVSPLTVITEDQAAGRACVWGAERLTLESAIDLGEHQGDDGTTLFLRACRTCTGLHAHRVLLDHGSHCPLCASEATVADCVVGRGLYRLQRECRR